MFARVETFTVWFRFDIEKFSIRTHIFVHILREMYVCGDLFVLSVDKFCPNLKLE